MSDDARKGRPKAKRKFKWNGTEWQENTAFDPNKTAKEQPPAVWVSAMGPDGKPVPNGESYGVLPDAMKFLPIWQEEYCIEEVQKRIWWCSQKQLRGFRTTLNSYLEPKGFAKLKILRSRQHLFGSTDKQAGANLKKLIDAGVIKYIPAADRA